jgi:hypothetical protein
MYYYKVQINIKGSSSNSKEPRQKLFLPKRMKWKRKKKKIEILVLYSSTKQINHIFISSLYISKKEMEFFVPSLHFNIIVSVSDMERQSKDEKKI